MKQKIMLCIVFSLLCAFGSSKANSNTKKILPTTAILEEDSENQLPPSVRKCLEVSCEPGLFCFHGRCKKIDYECLNKKCGKGERCNKGECVKQLHTPQKQICKPLGFQQNRLKCDKQQQQRCLTGKRSVKVCGFFANRTFLDFDNQCSACSNGNQIRFYFLTSCQWAPRVCREQQQCLNGACVSVFSEKIFENYRTCNSNKECKINERCGGHKCIDRRDMFNYLQSKAQTGQVGLSI